MMEASTKDKCLKWCAGSVAGKFAPVETPVEANKGNDRAAAAAAVAATDDVSLQDVAGSKVALHSRPDEWADNGAKPSCALLPVDIERATLVGKCDASSSLHDGPLEASECSVESVGDVCVNRKVGQAPWDELTSDGSGGSLESNRDDDLELPDKDEFDELGEVDAVDKSNEDVDDDDVDEERFVSNARLFNTWAACVLKCARKLHAKAKRFEQTLQTCGLSPAEPEKSGKKRERKLNKVSSEPMASVKQTRIVWPSDPSPAT
jgi:hypothetical protein